MPVTIQSNQDGSIDYTCDVCKATYRHTPTNGIALDVGKVTATHAVVYHSNVAVRKV